VIPVTFSGGIPWLPQSRKGRTTMKWLLILSALGLFLAAHGVAGFMSIYSEAVLDGSGSWSV
jgi:hypothetical protein